MPLLFFIDKDILDDPSCRDLEDVVLSYTFFKFVFRPPTRITLKFYRARRNERGQLEPDAEEQVVQKSLGFDKYEHGPKTTTNSQAQDTLPQQSLTP